MTRKLLILRPRPGAEETAARAGKLGLEAVVAPLFEVRPLEWEAPDAARFDAVTLTSGNAARHGGAGLASFLHLPCYAVGDSTGRAAREAGFADVQTGAADGAALLAIMAADGVRILFHPRGRDHILLLHPRLEIVGRDVYAAEAVPALPVAAAEALREGALALIHSARAGALFAKLVGSKNEVSIAAISEAAAGAAGGGWKSVAIAAQPRDEALLELAFKLCNSGGGGGGLSE